MLLVWIVSHGSLALVMPMTLQGLFVPHSLPGTLLDVKTALQVARHAALDTACRVLQGFGRCRNVTVVHNVVAAAVNNDFIVYRLVDFVRVIPQQVEGVENVTAKVQIVLGRVPSLGLVTFVPVASMGHVPNACVGFIKSNRFDNETMVGKLVWHQK